MEIYVIDIGSQASGRSGPSGCKDHFDRIAFRITPHSSSSSTKAANPEEFITIRRPYTSPLWTTAMLSFHRQCNQCCSRPQALFKVLWHATKCSNVSYRHVFSRTPIVNYAIALHGDISPIQSWYTLFLSNSLHLLASDPSSQTELLQKLSIPNSAIHIEWRSLHLRKSRGAL